MCAIYFAMLVVLMTASGFGMDLKLETNSPALSCRSDSKRCQYKGDEDGQMRFEVDGLQMTIVYEVGRLIIDCESTSVLDSPELPHANSTLLVTNVELIHCSLPVNRSLVEVFAATNVSLQCNEPDVPKLPNESRSNLTLSNLLNATQLTRMHFAGLECLSFLYISGIEYVSYPKLSRDLFAPLRSLHSLEMWRVWVHIEDLDALVSLRKLYLNSVAGVRWLPLTSTVESIKITNWSEEQPSLTPRLCCDSLLELRLSHLSATALPSGWLANCTRLTVLEINEASSLKNLPSNLLIGTSALTNLVIRKTRIEELPEELLTYSPRIYELTLDWNRLRRLLSGTFAKVQKLQKLNLHSNKLDSNSINALTTLVNLTYLNLASNRQIGDLCGSDGYSAIRYATRLVILHLSMTRINRICHDWREMKFLERLEMSYTKLTKLSFEDFLFFPMGKLEISMFGTYLKTVEMSRVNYTKASLLLSSNVLWWYSGSKVSLECDCRLYWTRRVLDLSIPVLERFGEMHCSNGLEIRDMLAENMECKRPQECSRAELPVGCKCSVRPDNDTKYDTLLVRADCQHLMLTQIPYLRAPSEADESEPMDIQRVFELQLSHNNISVIKPDDIQDSIKGLDLRHNQVSGVSPAAAARLGAVRGVLLLAGNPLECSCRAAPLLRALIARPAELTDRSEATCDDGSELYSTPLEQCDALISPTGWLAIALGGALALVLVVAVSLGTHERRFFVRVVLHRWGFKWRAAEPKEDDARRYDAFVTFSQKDEEVARELIERLEPRYRLCVHTRDWIPGRLIAEQVSESVSDSRRTLALVSRHFLSSGWACAEFREAHMQAMQDAQPRLLVVLLEEPSELHMICQLKRYVSSRTYLLRSDPWFWDKLEVALPKQRDPPISTGTSSSYVETTVSFLTENEE